MERQQQVIVEGEFSDSCSVDSGVPQGTVLGPLLFLCHINDLPTRVKRTVRLFADDCLLYKTIRTIQDQIQLQNDLKSLEEWASLWGMRFNASKCYIMSIHRNQNPLTYTFTLDNHILEKVNNNPYLGVLISDDLKWATHINKICNRANSTLAFLDLHLSISNDIVSTKIYDKRDDFDFEIVNFPFLDGDVLRSTSYGVYISQLIRFARASSYVADFNTRNKLLTQKLLKQGYRYHKLRKTFSKFYRRYYDLFSKFQVGLKSLLRQGLSEPDFYGDLVYKLKKIVGSNNFSAQFIKIISHYKKIGYNINVLQQTACLVVNPITVGNFAFLFNCTPVGRTSDSMMVPT